MRGIERLRSVERSSGPLAKALPELPQDETILVRLLRVSGYGLSDYFSDVFKSLGITENMDHLLAVLSASGAGQNSPTELSELIGTGRANMTKIIATLEKNNYVRRESGKVDARSNMVIITKEGKALVKRITPLVSIPIENAFSGLSKNEKATLTKLLRKTIISLDNAKTF